jgi:transcriptional regulator GlxA family with amidase domain
MRIAVLTFDGFNEIDSLVVAHIVNRLRARGWRAEITCPTERVTSMNGVVISAQQQLEFANEADAVLFGSGRMTRQLSSDPTIMSRIRLDPDRQLIASQCSGALLVHQLGLLGVQPVCSDRSTRPLLESAGIQVLDQPFYANGNIASAGGCLSAAYLAAWVIWRLADRSAAEEAVSYVLPVGEETPTMARIITAVKPYISPLPERETFGLRTGTVSPS